MTRVITVSYKPPDRLAMKWPYKPNYADINAAVKSCGQAKFNGRSKEWVIPASAGIQVAKAIKPHYPELSDAILAVPEVSEAHKIAAERVLLSSAIEAEPMSLVGLKHGELVRPYQWVAPHMFSAGGHNRLLIADDMGLGKSLQALLCILSGQYQDDGSVHRHKTLIVCPSVVKVNWANEVEKWTEMDASLIYGQTKEYEVSDITIINYDLLHARVEELLADDYDCIIFDECHTLKNQKAQRTKAAKRLATWPTVKGMIAMSGTPILNRPSEIFTVLNMLKPATFTNYYLFGKKYCGAIHNGYGWDFDGASNIETSDDGVTPPLNHLLKDIMLRRTMDDPRLSDQMPDLLQTIVEVDISRSQYDIVYNTLMDELEYYRTTGSGSMPPGLLLNILTDLRHAAGRVKVIPAFHWILNYIRTYDKPIVVFAHHRDVVEDLLAALKVELAGDNFVCGITGSTPDKHRQDYIQLFQEGYCKVLVCSTLAMKEGINLDAADTTLFVEREWVPAHERQAASRVRRITQESDMCHQVILSAANTVDTHFDKVVSEKEAIIKAALDGSESDKMIVAQAVADSLLAGRTLL